MSNLTAKDVMNPRVLSVRDDMTLHELATFLTENEISGVPVLDSGGKLVGVVSLTDIALSEAERASLEREQSGSTFDLTPRKKQFNREDLSGLHLEDSGFLVRDIMTPTAYTIPETLPVPRIAETMIAGRLHRLLVTRGRDLVGIVTPFDMMKLLQEE